MGTDETNKIINTKKMVTEELIQGQGFADRLRVLIHDHTAEMAAEKEDLMGKVLGCFGKCLFVLGGDGGADGVLSAGEVVEGRRMEECKKIVVKGRRGCYKRKKNSESWRTVSATIEDGHAWRKYGQKDILNTQHPRSYFRCTYKYDQGCKATKQVQRMEEDQSKYETIYIGQHTCKIMMMTTPPSQNIVNNNFDLLLPPSMIKQECNIKEDTTLSSTTTIGDHDLSENQSSSHHHYYGDHDSLMWEDLAPLDYSCDGFEFNEFLFSK